MRNEVLHRVKEENILNRIKRNKWKWIGYILRRNFLIKHIIGWKIGGRIEGPEVEEEDVSSYWMTLREQEVT